MGLAGRIIVKTVLEFHASCCVSDFVKLPAGCWWQELSDCKPSSNNGLVTEADPPLLGCKVPGGGGDGGTEETTE